MKVAGNFFTQEEVEKLHEMTLEVLEKDGVIMEDEEACELFRKHGAKVDGYVVHIGRDLVNLSFMEETENLSPLEKDIKC